MAKLINKTIEVGGRSWVVLSVNARLEILYVQEVGRNFKTVIAFEEVK